MGSLKQFLHTYRRFLILVLTPILLSPMVIAVEGQVYPSLSKTLNFSSFLKEAYYMMLWRKLPSVFNPFSSSPHKVLYFILLQTGDEMCLCNWNYGSLLGYWSYTTSRDLSSSANYFSISWNNTSQSSVYAVHERH